MLVAWIAGIASISIAAALTVQVLRLRRRSARLAREREAFLAAWRPVLFQAALGDEPDVPAVAGRDVDTFISLWNEVQEVIHPESRAGLGRVAEMAGADTAARLRLVTGHPVARVQALRMLGHLARPADYERVREFLDDPRAYLSLTAARALVCIDPARAPFDVVPRIAARADWPASLLVTALARANSRALATELRASCAESSGERLVRLLAVVELVEDGAGPAAEEILRRAFGSGDDQEVVAAVLKHARAPGLVDLARGACAHAWWAVRTQAAAALSRIGAAPDRELLLRLLRDPQWWVRYRAAQALLSGRFGSSRELTAIVEGLKDRYSRDILAHVLAERRA